MAEEMRKVPWPDHPQRCQATNATYGDRGQCEFFVVEGAKYCKMHGGPMATGEVKEPGLYRLRKWRGRIEELKNAVGYRTIEEELAILRMLLEETLNRCNSDQELMLYSAKICDLVMKIKELVVVADKLATKTGLLIDRTQALIIAGKVVEILATKIHDQTLLAEIADELGQSFLMTPEVINPPSQI